MNSILQWTRATPLFYEYFLEDQKYKDELEKGTKVENTMAYLYREITINQGKVNTIKILFYKLNFIKQLYFIFKYTEYSSQNKFFFKNLLVDKFINCVNKHNLNNF